MKKPRNAFCANKCSTQTYNITSHALHIRLTAATNVMKKNKYFRFICMWSG